MITKLQLIGNLMAAPIHVCHCPSMQPHQRKILRTPPALTKTSDWRFTVECQIKPRCGNIKIEGVVGGVRLISAPWLRRHTVFFLDVFLTRTVAISRAIGSVGRSLAAKRRNLPVNVRKQACRRTTGIFSIKKRDTENTLTKPMGCALQLRVERAKPPSRGFDDGPTWEDSGARFCLTCNRANFNQIACIRAYCNTRQQQGFKGRNCLLYLKNTLSHHVGQATRQTCITRTRHIFAQRDGDVELTSLSASIFLAAGGVPLRRVPVLVSSCKCQLSSSTSFFGRCDCSSPGKRFTKDGRKCQYTPPPPSICDAFLNVWTKALECNW
jgi:hypothetical protein